MSHRRWLECYVLRALDRLSPAERQALQERAPELRELQGLEGEWHQVLAEALGFPPTMVESIEQVWISTLEMARQDGDMLDPRAFAEMFVDANFPE